MSYWSLICFVLSMSYFFQYSSFVCHSVAPLLVGIFVVHSDAGSYPVVAVKLLHYCPSLMLSHFFLCLIVSSGSHLFLYLIASCLSLMLSHLLLCLIASSCFSPNQLTTHHWAADNSILLTLEPVLLIIFGR